MSAPQDLDAIDPRMRYVPRPNWSWQRKKAVPPETLHADRAIIDLELAIESEVMPSEGTRSETSPHDTSPQSATEGDRLDQIASLMRSLTYGEMLELATELWTRAIPSDGDNLMQGDLPGIFHRWSKERV